MKRMIVLAVVTSLSGCGSQPKGEVSGAYKFDGHDVTLHFVRATASKPVDGGAATDIVMSEKDGSAKFVSMDTYGSALEITLYKTKEGKYDIDSSSFHHSSEKGSGSGTGFLELKDVVEANGEISGEVFTKPGTKIMDQTLDVDLKFRAPIAK